MSSRALTFALLIAAAGCGRVVDDGPTRGGGVIGGTGSNTSDGGSADAGDGGVDAGRSCPGDPDGTQASTGVAIAELAGGTSGSVELLFFAPLERDRIRIDLSQQHLSIAGASATVDGRVLVELGALGNSGEVAVRVDGVLEAYLCWGLLPVTATMNEAGARGLWLSPGACALTPPPNQTLHLRATGLYANDFVAATPTPLGCAP